MRLSFSDINLVVIEVLILQLLYVLLLMVARQVALRLLVLRLGSHVLELLSLVAWEAKALVLKVRRVEGLIIHALSPRRRGQITQIVWGVVLRRRKIIVVLSSLSDVTFTSTSRKAVCFSCCSLLGSL
jgi:hypothetical protein